MYVAHEAVELVPLTVVWTLGIEGLPSSHGELFTQPAAGLPAAVMS